jgi:lipopolysaccharide/colanic/teichoic acid biosynthesis glycosyltransferase
MRWRLPARRAMRGSLHTPRSVAAAKRGFDITVALAGLAVTLPLWPLIALAIRLDGPGPVLVRQLRVGRVLPDRTELFVMMRFRSERAEAAWPGLSRVGTVLRATRLDELPLLLNVLRGEMAVIGPRPERPRIHAKLAREIPFFAERTAGLRPGLTGLAQLRQGHGTGIEEVQRKLAFDHAYAMGLTGLRAWLLADVAIMVRTLAVLAGLRYPAAS